MTTSLYIRVITASLYIYIYIRDDGIVRIISYVFGDRGWRLGER